MDFDHLGEPIAMVQSNHHLRYFYSMIGLPLALFLCNPYKT